MQWAWRHYYAPLAEAHHAVADWPRTALFLAGDGGLPYARAIHYLTGCKLLLPEHWDRFQHVLRHTTTPGDTGTATRCPSLRGLEVDYHASRRLGVVVEASGLTTEKCKRMLREYTKGGYDCHLVRIQRDATEQVDADLDPLFRRQRYVVETTHPLHHPWLRLIDSNLRSLIERVRQTYTRNRTYYESDTGTPALPLWEASEARSSPPSDIAEEPHAEKEIQADA